MRIFYENRKFWKFADIQTLQYLLRSYIRKYENASGRRFWNLCELLDSLVKGERVDPNEILKAHEALAEKDKTCFTKILFYTWKLMMTTNPSTEMILAMQKVLDKLGYSDWKSMPVKDLLIEFYRSV